MKIAAIIAEYNPFHNGHRYLAQTVRERTGADFVVSVMSGCFVQRGAPALLDKYTRTRLALESGIDLVIELPVVYALGQADQFASGAVRVLDALGCDFLGFGCEDDDLGRLREAAALFDEEPDDYWDILSGALKEGVSYPAAREKAACASLRQRNPEIFPSDEAVQTLLRGSNNILAISYLAAMHHIKSAMEPVPVLRIGSGHRETLLPETPNPSSDDPSAVPEPILLQPEGVIPGSIASDGTGQIRGKVSPRLYPSARAIREVLADSCRTHRFLSAYPALRRSVNAAVYEALQDARTHQTLQSEDDYTVMLRYRLLQADRAEILSACGQNEGLANRLGHHRSGWQSVTELITDVKHKGYTWTGISRALFRLLLNIDDAAETAAAQLSYARVLGMRTEASGILQEWKSSAGIPVILSLTDDTKNLTETQKMLLVKDLFAADLYAAATELKTGILQENEYTRKFLRI